MCIVDEACATVAVQAWHATCTIMGNLFSSLCTFRTERLRNWGGGGLNTPSSSKHLLAQELLLIRLNPNWILHGYTHPARRGMNISPYYLCCTLDKLMYCVCNTRHLGSAICYWTVVSARNVHTCHS
eukprot:763079-Hanusia_phi.AAC.3